MAVQRKKELCCNLAWRSFLTLSILTLSFICLCQTACTHVWFVVCIAARSLAFLLCLVLPYCCVCIFPATIRLHPPQALAAPPTPYGKAKETGRTLQDSHCASAVQVFFLRLNYTAYQLPYNGKYRYMLNLILRLHREAATSLLFCPCLCWRGSVTVQNIGHLCFGSTQSLIHNPVFKCIYVW